MIWGTSVPERWGAHLGAKEGNTEEDDASETLLNKGAEELLEPVDTPPALTGETGDLHAGIGLIGDEDGIHEHVFGEGALSLP